jgi:peptidyl-prolyl cis-trans isomerase B (cyclophilin B)
MLKSKFTSLVIICTVLASTFVPSAAEAAARPTSVPGCAPVTSKGHAPLKVREPMLAGKSLPKTMKIVTNCGPIVISLLIKQAPLTITKMAALARAKYFNNSLCHRLTTGGIFVLQCGDPMATGQGSPTGWKGYKDENLPADRDKNYPAGTVAMANSGPGTNGSQFFLVYKDTKLPPNYTIWGTITTGLDLLNKLSEVGAYEINSSDGKAYYASDGRPIQSIEIRSITLR